MRNSVPEPSSAAASTRRLCPFFPDEGSCRDFRFTRKKRLYFFKVIRIAGMLQKRLRRLAARILLIDTNRFQVVIIVAIEISFVILVLSNARLHMFLPN